MTNMTKSKLSIFSHPGKITIIGLLQDHFHIGPIWGSRDDNQANMEMPMY